MFDLSQIVKDWKESAALHAHINLYGFWDEETFLTKSGDLGVVLRVRGIDCESLDSTSRDHAVKRLEAALRTFDPRVRVYQALFKTNQPQIPHQNYANRLVNAAINQRMDYFAAKAEQLFSIDLYWIVVVQGGYAKSTLQQALRQLPAHPHRFLRDIHALFSQVRQRVFLQTQIERDHLLLRQKVSSLIGQLSDLVEIQLQGAEEAFRTLRRFINFGPFKMFCSQLDSAWLRRGAPAIFAPAICIEAPQRNQPRSHQDHDQRTHSQGSLAQYHTERAVCHSRDV